MRKLLLFVLVTTGMSSCIFPLGKKYDTTSQLMEFDQFRQVGQGVLWRQDFEYIANANLRWGQAQSQTLVWKEVVPAGIHILSLDVASNIEMVDITVKMNDEESVFNFVSRMRTQESFKKAYYLENRDTLRIEIQARQRMAGDGTIRIRPRLLYAEDPEPDFNDKGK